MSERGQARQNRRIEDPISVSLYVMVGLISLLCVLLIFIRIERMDSESFRFMLWNLFLAWLPLIVSMTAIRISRSFSAKLRLASYVVLGAGWLLLYPNAPYLTTDFIHLIFRQYDPDSLVLWYDLVVFFLFSWCGLLIGYISMRHFHVMIRQRLGKTAGWVFVCASSFLGGFGVYLGRVVRLNSWDALFSPFRLIEGILEGLNRSAFIFTCLFGMLSLILYVSLYALKKEDPVS
jgi:uncharacterized membrane protein